jgi:hypothetical protein
VRSAPSRALGFAVAAAAVAAVVLAFRSGPSIAVDDAAITFRYAERLATGHGLTYNDHERVLGASSPLHAALLAVPIAFGSSAEHAAWALGLISYVTAVALVVALAGRWSGLAGGVLAALFCLADTDFRFHALAGLEVGFAAALGLAVVALVAHDRMWLAGIAAGLVVVTKLDALALVASVGLASVALDRRLPWRFLAATLVIALPWITYATWTYGSPLPQSVVTKLAGGEGHVFDPLWLLRELFDSERPHAWLALIGLLFWAPSDERRATTALACWAILHVVAYSTVDLGAPYPWYIAVPLPIVALLAGCTGWWLVNETGTRAGWWSAVPALLLWLAVVWPAVGELRTAHRPRQPDAWEMFEADRRAAGRFLERAAAPGEVLETAYGWPAFASRLPVNDRARLNSHEFLTPVSYRVEHGEPARGHVDPPVPPGMTPLAVFDSAHRRFPDHGRFVVFGRPDSAAALAARTSETPAR